MQDGKKPGPFMAGMNSEEAQRYNGIRQALMDLPKNMVDPNRVANPYGVYYPDPVALQMQKMQETQDAKPVSGGEFNGAVRPDGMLPPATDGQPSDGGMAMAMPQPMMQQMQPMQQAGAGFDKRGLGKLMAGLAARTRGGF